MNGIVISDYYMLLNYEIIALFSIDQFITLVSAVI